jgi:uncharacterized DUF497 family protein
VAFQFHFEWDPAKARQNARKHRVTFERGATVFLDPNALSLFDEKHSDEEERWITLGLDQTGALWLFLIRIMKKLKTAHEYACYPREKQQGTKRNNIKGNRI